MERAWRVAKEMSNLIIYCRSVTFSVEQVRQGNCIYNEMSSFPETKAEKLMCQQESKLFLRYHKVIKLKFYCNLKKHVQLYWAFLRTKTLVIRVILDEIIVL